LNAHRFSASIISIMNQTVHAIVRELQRGLESLYGERLVKLVIFGSQVRGDALPGSDIDVMVVLRGSLDPSLEIARTGDLVASLSLENDVVVSCVFVSEERYCSERSPLLLNAGREGVTL